jgi:very-short-patch-repair endonuclease
VTQLALEAVDHRIAAIAGTRHGLVTAQQLLAVGLTRHDIAYRTKIGRLHRVYRGVYAVGHRPISAHARAMAAVLAGGPGAVLSHGSAATLWGIHRHWRAPFEVTAAHRRGRAGLRVHRSRTLIAQDVTEHFGIPVTTPARTLLDNAPRLREEAFARAFNELRLARFLFFDDVAELLDRHPPTRAAKRLRGQVTNPRRAPTRSDWERMFPRFVKRFSLPEPLVNTEVAGHEADLYFPEHKLVIELDGYDTHRTRASFESDRDRDADRLAAGLATVRMTWDRFSVTPGREADRLHAIIRRR